MKIHEKEGAVTFQGENEADQNDELEVVVKEAEGLVAEASAKTSQKNLKRLAEGVDLNIDEKPKAKKHRSSQQQMMKVLYELEEKSAERQERFLEKLFDKLIEKK